MKTVIRTIRKDPVFAFCILVTVIGLGIGVVRFGVMHTVANFALSMSYGVGGLVGAILAVRAYYWVRDRVAGPA